MVLLLMVDDKKAENQQPGGNAAKDSRHKRKDGKGRGERQEEKDRSGKYVPPAPRGVIAGVRFRGGNEFRSSSQLHVCFVNVPEKNAFVDRSSVTSLHRVTTPKTVDRRKRTD